jgi:hypothetical protein
LGNFNGFEPNDVIKKLNGQPISSKTDLENVIKAIPSGTTSVPIEVFDINSRTVISSRYFLKSNAGVYQTNFGQLELSEKNSRSIPNATDWNGTLKFKDKSLGSATISGRLRGGIFDGISSHPVYGTQTIRLTKSTGDMYMGSVGSMTFVIIKKD